MSRSWSSPRRHRLLAVAVALGATALAIVLVAVAMGRDGSSGERRAVVPLPTIEHQALSDGWQPVDLALPDETYSLRPTKVTAAGVAVASGFDLASTSGDLDDNVAAMLRVEPAIEFAVKRERGSTLRIQPAAELRRETSYRFTLVDPGDQHEIRSWAFQTESPLRVVQSLPGDKAVAVPAASGIELTFSHDGVTGVEERFRIEPAVAGRFETHKRVVVFVPEKLEYRTLYTVTLDPGVGVEGVALTMDEPFTFSFETGSADQRDDQNQNPGPTFSRLLNESAAASEPVLEMFSYPTVELSFDVYRYPDIAAFTGALTAAQEQPQWSYWGRRNFRLPATGLDRAATFLQTPVQQQQSYYFTSYAVFPDVLPLGFYLVQASDGALPAQTLLQVTDIAAYASISQTKSLVWVNDVGTKAPIDDARIEDQHGHTFRTGGDGVALFDTPEEILPPKTDLDGRQPYSSYNYRPPGAQGYLLVRDGDRVAVAALEDASPIGFVGFRYDARHGSIYYSGGSDKFWSFVYSDRQLYRKTDDVRVWGVAKPREGFKPGERLTLRLTGNDYSGYNYEQSVVSETSVAVGEFGTFEGDIKLDAVGPGYYQLEVRAGDDLVTSTSFRVEDFVKPAYKIDITPSKRAVIVGDAMTFDFDVQFFDGSPVPFVELAIGGDVVPGGEQIVRTDAEGKLSFPYTPTDGDPWSVAYRQIYARVSGPEEGEITGQAMLYVLPATVTLDDVSARTESGTGIVTGSLHDVDFSAFDESDQAYSYNPYAGSPVAGGTVTARVTQISYTKTETGETYDFIAKVTRKQYEYQTVETDAGSFTATSAADGTFELRFPVGAERSYRVELSVQDGAGRTARAQTWVSGADLPYFPSYGDQSLSLAESNISADPNIGYQTPSLYSDGEGVDLTMRRGRERGDEGVGVAYLFQRAQAGIRTYDVQASPRYGFDFTRDDAPNLIVAGVQFNGFGYEQTSGDYNAAFDYKGASVEMTVTADRERYAPGDDVTLSVETRDAAGNPVAAEAILSGVDEALVQLQGFSGTIDIAQQLYQSLPSGVLSDYVPSFGAGDKDAALLTQPQRGGGPDTGGPAAGIAGPDTGPGPSADPRADFRDTALFQTVRTGSDGRGSVTFKLPDNVTSWRVTSYAVTQDLRAGAGKADVAVGLPFFVDATISEEYLAADRPVIALRSFGSDLTSADQVRYSVSIPSLGGDAISATAPAFERASITLPPLTDGEHEVTIRATSGALADAIVRKVIVVASRLRKGDARFYELAPGVTLEGADGGRTRVIFSDHNRGRYYGDLLQLGATYGDRVDQMLARSLSQDLLRTYFDAEDVGRPAQFNAALYQRDDGGIALFPYADGDLTLAARVASVATGRFSAGRLAQYFRAVLDDPKETRERSIIALFGLATTGAPVMPSIERFARASDLSVREHLYLGLAALAAGDEDVAREQYRQVLLGYGERRDPAVRIRVGVDQDDILEATSLAADLGAGLGDASAAALFAYTAENRTTDLLVELDRVSYLVRALPRLPSTPVRFSYVVGGERKEATLAAGRSLTLTVTPAELAALDPQRLDGKVGIATFFETPFDPASVSRDPDISITRTIDVDGGGIGEGDLVQIRLDYVIGSQALDGCYQLTDLAPSGLRPVSRTMRPYDGEPFLALYPYLIDGQRVSFCAYRSARYYPAAYWARVVTKGDYAVEPAIMQSQQSSTSFNFAPGGQLHVE